MHRISRREVLIAGSLTPSAAACAQEAGMLVGDPTAERVGRQVLADGGNAVDALVAGALAAGLVSPYQTGPGGYGGAMLLARDRGRQVFCLDFNGTAPALLRPDSFRPGADGKVPGNAHLRGWLAAGVPGVLAGLQEALNRFGTKSFRELAQPAIELARQGVPITREIADRFRSHGRFLAASPGARRLFFRGDEPLPEGATLRYPRLAEMLETLARRNSVESFYRGDVAGTIADAYRQGGGLLTRDDLAAFRVRAVPPLEIRRRGHRILTAPVTAGGVTTLQALASLEAAVGDAIADESERAMLAVEVLREAWRDRLALLGDVPDVERICAALLSPGRARETATRAREAARQRKPGPGGTRAGAGGGTLSLSAADLHGNVAALTYTHGESFGACVVVPELDLVLGHGMSRFDPSPGHPNSPGPGKRPLHNMCPTLVIREDGRIAAVGARGGRRIPNTLFAFLNRYAGPDGDLPSALAQPRLHTEGDLDVFLEPGRPHAERDRLSGCGYRVAERAPAVVSAVELDLRSGRIQGGLR